MDTNSEIDDVQTIFEGCSKFYLITKKASCGTLNRNRLSRR